MDFRRKLDLLSVAALRGGVPALASLAPAPAESDLGPESGQASEAVAPLVSDVLASLRRKMAEILERPLPPPRPPADPSETLLPFSVEPTEWGPLYRRHKILPASHHVGRMPASAAKDSRPELLALLALDPSLSRVSPERALYLDTETTGLGGAGVLPFLIGLAWFDSEGRLNLEQFLLRSPGQEPALLEALRERLSQAELIVSYNGKTFDWPLLKGRYVMNRLPVPADLPHLDLLHIGRRLHRARLGGCRLIHLESEVLGFVRGPDIEGGEIAPRYAHFLRTGEEEALAAVVEHNLWDVVSMAALVGLYGEPFDLMHAEDLVGFARTMKRAGALAVAERAASRALELGASRALRVRGDVHKARGDRARALQDFEQLAHDLDDPELRLELAKLYEHFVKDPARALSLIAAGVAEKPAAFERRRSRLERKAEAASTRPPPRSRKKLRKPPPT